MRPSSYESPFLYSTNVKPSTTPQSAIGFAVSRVAAKLPTGSSYPGVRSDLEGLRSTHHIISDDDLHILVVSCTSCPTFVGRLSSILLTVIGDT